MSDSVVDALISQILYNRIMTAASPEPNSIEYPSRRIGFLLFLFPASLPALSYWISSQTGAWGIAAVFVPIVFFIVIPFVDLLVGVDSSNPSSIEVERLRADRFYRWLPLLCLPLYVGILIFGLWVLTVAPFSKIELLLWTLSIGLVGGVIAINPAHELIHKASSFEPLVGGALLSCVCYGTFKIEHIHGHHVHVATEKDNSTARLGESIYSFLYRAIRHNVLNAIQLEKTLLYR